MTARNEPTGSLDTALAHAERLLVEDPRLAVQQAAEILRVVPGQPVARTLLARGLYGIARQAAAAGQGDAALDALRRSVQADPLLADAWRSLADHYHALGDAEAADAAYARSVKASTRDPRLLEPAVALVDGRVAVAEALLRAHLKQFPTDVAAIRMLAEVAGRVGRWTDAANLLERCLELAPGFAEARRNYALVLHRENRHAESLAVIDELLAADPRLSGLRSLKGSVLSAIGEYDRAIEAYAGVLAEYPQQARLWMSYGHALKTAGRVEESIAAYRRSAELLPTLGEVWWSLANLKTFRFTDEQVSAMQAQLADGALAHEDRFHFHFALGKALEDRREYSASFEHYAAGNALRRKSAPYDPATTTRQVRQACEVFTADFFAARAGSGASAPDPIFIVGMPRAGSTLVEQILASHSQVEGTMELPDLISIVRKLRRDYDGKPYLETLADVPVSELRALGERYLETTRVQRKTGAPFFIDKLPNNWAHVGLIQLILPNAKIIDARRHPLSCCFSIFKQHFARGQHFGYDLANLGRYYGDYVRLMAHFDAVLPGRVHRVIYERMVEDTEGEVRALLAYCGLEFEPGCLEFYRNERAVRTPSSEQVRQPIYRDGLDQWQHYEAWLEPLKQALGEVLTAYPEAPAGASAQQFESSAQLQ